LTALLLIKITEIHNRLNRDTSEFNIDSMTFTIYLLTHLHINTHRLNNSQSNTLITNDSTSHSYLTIISNMNAARFQDGYSPRKLTSLCYHPNEKVQYIAKCITVLTAFSSSTWISRQWYPRLSKEKFRVYCRKIFADLVIFLTLNEHCQNTGESQSSIQCIEFKRLCDYYLQQPDKWDVRT